jgi:hypothetical protein
MLRRSSTPAMPRKRRRCYVQPWDLRTHDTYKESRQRRRWCGRTQGGGGAARRLVGGHHTQSVNQEGIV